LKNNHYAPGSADVSRPKGALECGSLLPPSPLFRYLLVLKGGSKLPHSKGFASTIKLCGIGRDAGSPKKHLSTILLSLTRMPAGDLPLVLFQGAAHSAIDSIRKLTE
jgi:hypothetical protein